MEVRERSVEGSSETVTPGSCMGVHRSSWSAHYLYSYQGGGRQEDSGRVKCGDVGKVVE